MSEKQKLTYRAVDPFDLDEGFYIQDGFATVGHACSKELAKRFCAQHGADLTQLAKSKIDQMGGTICGVLVRNEAGALAAVSDLGRVTWLDGADSGESEDGKGSLPWFVEVYNHGYQAGHNDTVEGYFSDIHHSDLQTYHEEEVMELLEGLNIEASYPKPPANQVPDDKRIVSVEWLKGIRRDLDACQKVIWAALRGECDPAYCEDAQKRLKEIDALLSAQPDAGAGQWIEGNEPPHGGNWLTYRPEAPREARVVTLWYDPNHNGWSGNYAVTHYMERPQPPQGEN